MNAAFRRPSARLVEQGNLLGGMDLVALGPGSRPLRTVTVDPRWKVGFAAALALVVEHGQRARATQSVPHRARCPRCQREGDTVRDFGVRSLRGRRLAQSWCRNCRAVQRGAQPRRQADWLAS